MIRLSYTQYAKEFRCKIDNISELSVQTLHDLENFASSRSGSLDYNKESFSIPKRIELHHLQELFKLTGMEVFISEQEPVKEKISDMATINFGKFKGQKWTDLDESYLQWLSTNLNSNDRQIALAELESRKNTKLSSKQQGPPKELDMIIGFGKFRGRTWGELPADYLNWVVSNLQGEAVRYAKQVLEWKTK